MSIFNFKLFDQVSERGVILQHVAEVGVWHPETSNILQWISRGVRTTLVEPDPESIRRIKRDFGNLSNVTLHEVAISDAPGYVEMCKRGPSTFLAAISGSPAVVNDQCVTGEAEKFSAKAVKFSDIDDGTIDLISIDVEGAEWLVLKNMVSRPTVISIETHGGAYRNPNLAEIKAWTRQNNYRLWFKNGSDSVYVRSEKFPLRPGDSVRLALQSSRVVYRRFRAISGRILRNRRSQKQ